MSWVRIPPNPFRPIVTSDFVYLRLIGVRRLAETQFGKTEIDRTEENSMDVRRNVVRLARKNIV
jgi:hypothetical protein